MKRVVVGVSVLATALMAAGSARAEDGIDTNTITDSASTNTVRIVTLMLAAAGILMAAVTVWYWRGTRPDPEALGPLLVMSRRGFARLDPIEQRRQLDELRPGIVTDPPESPSLPEMLPPTDRRSDSDDEDAGHRRDDDGESSIASSTETTTGPAVADEDEGDEVATGAVDTRDPDDDWPDLDDWGGFDVVGDEKDRDSHDRRDDVGIVPDGLDESDSRSPRRPGPIDPLLG